MDVRFPDSTQSSQINILLALFYPKLFSFAQLKMLVLLYGQDAESISRIKDFTPKIGAFTFL